MYASLNLKKRTGTLSLNQKNKHKLDDVFDELNESGLFKSINYSSRIDAMLS